MFRWQKELDRLTIPARRVLRLQQAFNRVQVALPGLPSQEATAYLCAFSAGRGVRVAAVLHLHLSRRMAIYLNEQGEVSDRQAGAVFSEGIAFVEAMGFMLDDLQIQHLSPEERETLWRDLPLGEEKPGAGGGAPVALASGERTGESPHGTSPESDLSEEEKWMPQSMRRRIRPSPEQMEERRMKLLESLGRFMASM